MGVLDCVARWLDWWRTPDKVSPIKCPYCSSMDRADIGNCRYSYEHPEYGVSGADPPCLTDGYGA